MHKSFIKVSIFVVSFFALVFFSSCANEPTSPSATADLDSLALSLVLSNWMSSLSNDVKLTELSIPGSHDAAARVDYSNIRGTARAQSLSISEQLNFGTRFLDIRNRRVNDEFQIYHGIVDQRISFSQVLQQVYAFLNSNTNETIIMSIKEEQAPISSTMSFVDILNKHINANSEKWFTGAEIPTLGQARGKIVLFSRFSVSNLSLGLDVSNGWSDNATFEIATNNNIFKIQDEYEVRDNDDKWQSIEALLNEAAAATANQAILYVNFTSGFLPGIAPNLLTVSDNINPRLESYLISRRTGRFGLVVMDFTDERRNRLIVRSNFP